MKQEEIQKYADELAQEYFPDEHNIWARENIEAQLVSAACMRMAKYVEQELIEKACEWLEDTDFDIEYWNNEEGFCKREFIKDFRKVIEEE